MGERQVRRVHDELGRDDEVVRRGVVPVLRGLDPDQAIGVFEALECTDPLEVANQLRSLLTVSLAATAVAVWAGALLEWIVGTR